jgi:hypothetical protein
LDYKILKTTAYNTDNKSNLFVTVFAELLLLLKMFSASLKPGFPHRAQVSSCTWTHYLASGSLHREAAPVSSAMLLHRDSILIASQLVPRFRQLTIKLALGWQKPRHAPLPTSSDKYCFKD